MAGRGTTATMALERAKIPMKPGEYVVFAICGAVVLAALLVAITEQRSRADIDRLAEVLGAAVAAEREAVHA